MSVVKKPRLTPLQSSLVVANRGLAEKISHDFLARAPGLDIEEVVAVAYQGLISAALAFDERLGVEGRKSGHFSGYARIRIHGAILDWQRSEDYLQRTLRFDLKALQAAGYTEGRSYDVKALEARTGIRPRRIETVIRTAAANPTSSDALRDLEASLPSADATVESAAVASSILSSASIAIQNLPLDQQVVLALHHFQGFELARVAELLGSSVTLVRIKHSEAVATVHAAMIKQAKEA